MKEMMGGCSKKGIFVLDIVQVTHVRRDLFARVHDANLNAMSSRLGNQHPTIRCHANYNESIAVKRRGISLIKNTAPSRSFERNTDFCKKIVDIVCKNATDDATVMQLPDHLHGECGFRG